MNDNKTTVEGLEGFTALVGTTIGPSRAIEVTQEKIEQFCLATENTEWIHWDKERCAAAPFGTIIAPSWFAPSYFSKLFFEMVSLEKIDNMLLMGSDRIRLLSPLKCGAKFTMTVVVAKVEHREKGIAVFYDASFTEVGQTKPISVTNVIIRYW
jgi:acyl dehydratase